jgi:hypothetical protein
LLQQTNPQPQQPNQQQCTAAQQQAAQLAGALEDYSHLSGLFALGTGITAAISGLGEGVTLGVDTPVTISFASATAFFATESGITGAAAAALNSFASGNTAALANFDVSSLTGTAASGIAEEIPGVGSYAEVVGQLAEQVADVVNAAQEACE